MLILSVDYCAYFLKFQENVYKNLKSTHVLLIRASTGLLSRAMGKQSKNTARIHW